MADENRRSRAHLAPSSQGEVNAFVQKARELAPQRAAGHLIFALDATASRQLTWDHACQLQGEMFIEAARVDRHRRLRVQLVWYRGFAEFHAAAWTDRAADLLAEMNKVQCAGGATQIEQVLTHAIAEARRRRINAVVFVGDCVEENPAHLYSVTGQLRLLGVPVFMFQEGDDSMASATFAEIAALSAGAYCRFDQGSAAQLRALLLAVAAYASGGKQALDALAQRSGSAVKRLSRQIQQR